MKTRLVSNLKCFDLHCDTLTKLKEKDKNLAVFKQEKFIHRQVFSVFIEDTARYPFKKFLSLLSAARKFCKGEILSLENGGFLAKYPFALNFFKYLNIKSVMLTWNGENALAGGVDSNKDLSEKGKKIIKKLNKNKIALDLSHLNEKSFYSAAKRANVILASHSNCFAVCPHKRNLKDDQIKMIIQKNGIIGINFYPPFLGEDVFGEIYRNIVHILSLGGENAVALGSDFDGALMGDELNSIEKLPDLYEFLKNKGIKKRLLDKIFYYNAYNFYNGFDK